MLMNWEELPLKERAGYIKIGVANGLKDVKSIKSHYNKFTEGGIPDTYKPWYWFTPNYNEEPSLKEAITKAYNDGRKGDNIMYKGKAYKALLNDKEERSYNIEKQHELNRNITNEQVVDNYINYVLWTMENPKNAGLRNDGLYYPYRDSASPKNLGPGINYTSNIGKNLDFSGNTGYTREKLNKEVRPDLLEKMGNIMIDLHDMYGDRADTMSLGNRTILLDNSHNVVEGGKKRKNMPKAWPSLVGAMMSGNTKRAKKETYSGSVRRQQMRNDLLWKNIIDSNTVKNR